MRLGLYLAAALSVTGCAAPKVVTVVERKLIPCPQISPDIDCDAWPEAPQGVDMRLRWRLKLDEQRKTVYVCVKEIVDAWQEDWRSCKDFEGTDE